MAQETEEDKGFLQSTADFFKNLDYGELAESSIPLVGENLIIGDIKENLASNSYGSAAINAAALALGTVPIVGDLAAKPFKELAKKYSKAKDALKEGIKKNPTNLLLKKPATHFFKTAKGSEYVRVQGGTTVRHKEPRKDPGHEGAKGFQVPSSTTIYVDEKGVKIASQFYRASETPDLLGKRQLIPTEKNKAHIVFSESFSPPTKTSNAILKRMGYKTKIESGDVVKNSEFLFSTTPKTGTYPLEIYNSGTGIHIGNKITEVAPVSAADILKYTKTELKMAKGGPVMALEEQTEMAFGDQPPRVDPVSGNEVPPGALPSEVRDDIPARLSEGEYVVPADVLQFFGIKFFEDLRTQAKTELAGLESNGRMGGEPLDDGEDLLFSADELNTYEDNEPIAANMGGMIRGYEEGGVTEMQPIGPQSVLKTYINDVGERLFIRFVNGIAIPPVPPGYREEGTPSPTSGTTPITTPTGQAQGKDESDEELQKGEPEIFPRNLDKMNAAQLAQYAAEISKTNVYKTVTRQPVIGFLARRQSKKVTDYLENQIKNVAKDSNMAEFYQALLDGIENGDRAGLEEIVKEIKTNNPELNTKVLVSGSQISKDRNKDSTVVDPLTNSNNTIGLGGTEYGTDISAAQERSFTMPGTITTAQKDAATTGGTEVDATSKDDPFGIGSGGEFDTDVTSTVDNSDVVTSDEPNIVTVPDPFGIGTEGEFGTPPPAGVASDYVVGEEGGLGTESTAIKKRDSLLNKVRSEAYTLTPFGAIKNVITNIKEGFGKDTSAEDEGKVINLLSEVNNNPENATSIIENISAQDSTALASNLMSPRFGYESGRDDLQERMVTGPGGVERLPLTDSQTLAQQDAMLESKIKANEEAYQKTLAEIAKLEVTRKTRQEEDKSEQERYIEARQEEAELKEKSSKGIAERVERARSGVGGFNKGGLASKRKVKKRKSK